MAWVNTHRANMRAIRFNMGNNLILRRWIFCAEISGTDKFSGLGICKQDPFFVLIVSKQTIANTIFGAGFAISNTIETE